KTGFEIPADVSQSSRREILARIDWHGCFAGAASHSDMRSLLSNNLAIQATKLPQESLPGHCPTPVPKCLASLPLRPLRRNRSAGEQVSLEKYGSPPTLQQAGRPDLDLQAPETLASRPSAVVEVNHAVGEAVFVQ